MRVGKGVKGVGVETKTPLSLRCCLWSQQGRETGKLFLKLRVEETKPRRAKSHTAVNTRVAGKEAGS